MTPSAFSGVTIAANFTGAAANGTAAIAVAGQDTATSTSWADGAAAVNGGACSAVENITYSTTHAGMMVVVASRMSSIANPTTSGSWTVLDGANFMVIEYQLASSIGTSTSGLTTGAQ